jgi:hypothetical protein
MGLTASGFAQERQRPLQERLNECFLKKQLMHLPHRNAGLADAGEHFGDIPLELKENLPVAWYQDVYDHLDDKCKALLGETRSNGTPGCPPMYLASASNDWLHGNMHSVQHGPQLAVVDPVSRLGHQG